MPDHIQKCLVIVEDEPAHTGLLIRALDLVDGLHVAHTLSDGEAAIAYLTGPDCPHVDLLLVDLRLPRRNGLDVIRAVRPHPRYDDALLVVLTTSARDDEVRKALRAGADYYILKPFDIFSLGPLLLRATRQERPDACCCQEEAFSALNLKFCPAPACEGRRLYRDQPATTQDDTVA